MKTDFFRRLVKSKMIASTAIMTIGNGFRSLIGLVTFIIVAGTMGTSQFGAFVTIVALVGLVSTFSGWGSVQLILRRVARSPDETAEALGSGLIYLAISAPILILISILVIPHLVPREIPFDLIPLVALADIPFSTLNQMCASVFQALRRPISTAQLNVTFSLARLIGALFWVFSASNHDPISWAWVYFAASTLMAVFSIGYVVWHLGPPRLIGNWKEWKDGFHFSILLATYSLFKEIDKPVVAAISSLSTVGIYAAANRISDGSTIPIRALVYSTTAEFFRAGAQGPRQCLNLAIRLLPVSLGISVLCGSLVAVMAWLAPILLGPSYHDTRETLLVLTVLTVPSALFYLSADALMGCDYPWLRTTIQLVMPVVDVGLCVILVPRLGAPGAAIAAVCAFSVAAVAGWGALVILSRRPFPVTPAEEGV